MELVNLSGFSPAWIAWKIRPPQWSMIVVVKGTFKLVPGGAAERAETQLTPTGNLFVDDDPELPQIYEHDFAPWKPKVDLLFDATSVVPEGGAVTVRVGTWSKRLAVKGGPRLFHAGPKDLTGLGPVQQLWPVRMKKAGPPGSYDKKWIKTRWPWWPEDFDWTLYNAAPDDQQVEKLAGAEEIAFENLHVKHPEFVGRLPGVRPRVFTSETSGFYEIPMILDTLWAKPDAETLVLVWRGHRDVRTEKIPDITHLFMVSEPLRAPARDYKAMLDEELAKKKEPEEEPAPEPEAPAPEPEPEPAPEPGIPAETQAEMEKLEKQAAEMEEQAAKLEADARAQMEKLAKEHGVTLPSTPPPMPKPEEIVKQIVDGLLKAKEAILAAGQEVPPKLQEAIDNPPKPEDFEIPEIPEEPLPAPEEAQPEPEPPPPPTREEVIARKGELDGLDLTGMDLSGADLGGARMRGTILRDANLSSANLTGADLSGAVLVKAVLDSAVAKGASFQAADLTEASLRDTDLTEAKFEGTNLVAADLMSAKLGLADLTDADLSRANLAGVEARKARFARAMLPESRLEGADFSGANLSGAALMRAEGARVSFEGADLTQTKASESKLPEANLKKVRADGSVWEGADLTNANFSFARLKKAEFSSAKLDGAKFISADVREGRFVEASLRKADLTRMNLFRGSLEKADLAGACLAEANLYEAETWEAALEGVDLRGANVKGSKLAMR